jgi:predicted RNA polymerase sigma factor
VSTTNDLNDFLRELAPRTIGVLARHFGGFATCEDAAQEALLAAAQQWPVHGVPANPQGWIATVSRRRIEFYRAETARRWREEFVVAHNVVEATESPEIDDTLTVLLLCCHTSLTLASQVALTLWAMGGLSTAGIAAPSWCQRP